MNSKDWILSKAVRMLTEKGYYVWQVAKLLNLSEAQVVRYQGRA